MRKAAIFEVYEAKKGKRNCLFTRSIGKGPVYGESVVKDKGSEYREWDPKRSKLAAFIMKGAGNIGIRKGDYVLYLGCATGTTVSHVSDIVGKEGAVFALDFAPRVMREMVFLAEQRSNIIPIMADAGKPMEYAGSLVECDAVYQDVAQRSQAEIFLKNCRLFLKKGGYGLLAVKAKSIDISKRPREVFRMVRSQIEKEMIVVDYKELGPLEKDHCMLLCKKK